MSSTRSAPRAEPLSTARPERRFRTRTPWLHLALPITLAALVATPARADSLRPPVGDPLWRLVDGAGGDTAGGRIGVAPFALAMALSFPAAVAGVGGGFLAAALGGAVSAGQWGPGVVAGSFGAFLVGGLLTSAAVVTAGLAARVRTNWLLGGILGGTAAALAIVGLAFGPIGGNAIAYGLFAWTTLAAAAIAAPLGAFGAPACAWWRDPPG